MREADLESHFRRAVAAAGGTAHKLVSPAERGAPDRFVLFPGGRVYFVELKTPTGKLMPDQVLWHRRAALLGTAVITLYGRDQIDNWIKTTREGTSCSPPSPSTVSDLPASPGSQTPSSAPR